MAISMYRASVPVFQHELQALRSVLAKAEEQAGATRIDPTAVLTVRLAGQEPPSDPDTEQGFAELRARMDRTPAFLATLPGAAIDGHEERGVEIRIAGKPTTLQALSYLLDHALPNFLFHTTTAYAILRHYGVDLGKGDFLGRS